MLLRTLEEKDIPIICAFPQSEEELFFLFPKATYPLKSSQLREAILQRKNSMVIVSEGEITGFANFYRWEKGGCCSIGNVVISPDARGRGVGRFLIERMIDLAISEHQASEITVACFNQNTAGLLLYTKLGFKPYAIEVRKDGKGNQVALIHMRLFPNAI